MKTLSVAMIVKNEERVLSRILSCLTFADEVVVVDTGSTDSTCQIALSFGAKLYNFVWIDDFAAARNFAFKQAKCNYVMWLDADDVISYGDIQKITAWKQSDSLPDTVMAEYCVGEGERQSFAFFRERILRNCAAAHWMGRIHETIAPFGKIEYADFKIRHCPVETHTMRNLKIYGKMLEEGEIFDERNTYYYARELYASGNVRQAQKYFKKFLRSANGYFIDKIGALVSLSDIEVSKGNFLQAKKYLTQTFAYGLPRAETCCKLGALFLKENDFAKAAYWYELALRCNDKEGFIISDYGDFVPYVQLCICYYNTGDVAKSYEYHRRAFALQPDNAAVKHNQEFFAAMGITDGGI
ncbi:MAG: glycosyltransferase [Corallococcus sp.]|nr:glycosyltransferase [Corallococcus sp.]